MTTNSVVKLMATAALMTTIPVGASYAGPANEKAKSMAAPQPVSLSGFGAPLRGVAIRGRGRGITNAPPDSNIQRFSTGQVNFKELEPLPKVGPVMNGVTCTGCHSQPTTGGGGLFINEIRVRYNRAPGPVHIFAADNMLRASAQSQGGTTIFPNGVESEPLGCQITAPGCQYSACQQEEAARTTYNSNLPTCDPTSSSFARGENCMVGRSALALFGDGLVEAVSDDMLKQVAASEPAEVRGMVKAIDELGQSGRVARFGWKDDHADLRAFAGDAYLNEMGITNPDNPNEISQCASNVSQYGVLLEGGDEPEDTTDPSGRADIDRFSDFMRMLAPPPTMPPTTSAKNGQKLFASMGCAGCHTPDLKTDSNPAAFIPPTTGGQLISASLNTILANKTFHPYGDFLLHDMGALGDGITSGVAGPKLMRTAPLWGLRAKSSFLHDGRANELPVAISLHDGQGKAAATAFTALSPEDQQDVLNFLETL